MILQGEGIGRFVYKEARMDEMAGLERYQSHPSLIHLKNTQFAKFAH